MENISTTKYDKYFRALSLRSCTGIWKLPAGLIAATRQALGWLQRIGTGRETQSCVPFAAVIGLRLQCPLLFAIAPSHAYNNGSINTSIQSLYVLSLNMVFLFALLLRFFDLFRFILSCRLFLVLSLRFDALLIWVFLLLIRKLQTHRLLSQATLFWTAWFLLFPSCLFVFLFSCYSLGFILLRLLDCYSWPIVQLFGLVTVLLRNPLPLSVCHSYIFFDYCLLIFFWVELV